MAFVLDDNVAETSITSGTGAFSLGGAVAGFKTFDDYMANGDTTLYAARLGTEWETGVGTFNSGSNSLSRTTLLASSTGSAISFSAGTKTIICAPLAAKWLKLLPVDRAAGFTDGEKTQARTNVTSGLRTITGADSITVADWGKTILFNSGSAITVTLSAVATLGDGFWCRFKNIGAGAVTLDPNSSETIDGQATSLVPQNDCGEIHCTGSVLHTIARPPVLALTSGTISSATTVSIDLSAFKVAGFNRFELRLDEIRPATDGSYLVGDLSNNAGSSYVSSNYLTPALSFIVGTITGYNSTSQANFRLTDSTGNAVGEVTFATVVIEIGSATTRVSSRGAHLTTTGAMRGLLMEGWLAISNANAFRFYQNSGNMTSGSWSLVGFR